MATTRLGSTQDDVRPPKGPGMILMGGGTDVDSAFVWAHDVIAGDPQTKAGDVLVIRATGADGYDAYLNGLAMFSSVQTLVIPRVISTADLAIAAKLVDRAELIFFAGGNQADYVAWKDSELMKAVQRVYQRGGVIGGTSAGLAIMGPFVFDAVSAGTASVTTGTATRDPFDPAISFTRGMLNVPFLKNLVTDSHFRQRERFGRLATFMARQFADGAISAPDLVTGLGVDEATAVLLDKNGKGVLAPGSTGAAYVIKSASAVRIVEGQSFLSNTLDVIRLDAAEQYYDFVQACGTGARYNFTVDGANLYPMDAPYTVSASPGTCP
ncbi:MAG TPA: cyanophycinase [Oligoflexus sp.]|uniref:cyanophycinase n=1 Tax=Oligoflexus sp. TaxID=1971216 RepID=UPI002D7FEFA2|nr:cyanophycinase [Oligoflexus sp.]HET9237574.1 cyanophycinase [Oligoflexus sp.]